MLKEIKKKWCIFPKNFQILARMFNKNLAIYQYHFQLQNLSTKKYFKFI